MSFSNRTTTITSKKGAKSETEPIFFESKLCQSSEILEKDLKLTKIQHMREPLRIIHKETK